ncbi:MAG: hypothetical protein CLLPBCKN_002956 [Chroococcidiopsis cubana SAG 39.79]|nr:hypothetical protein [Chroococcidiopsis cubana SAG 39.79]
MFSEQQYLTPNKVLNLSLNSAIDSDYQIAIEDKQNLENKEFSFERQSNTKTKKYIFRFLIILLLIKIYKNLNIIIVITNYPAIANLPQFFGQAI